MGQFATAFAPGRVNLIGEHTDYNEGLALPFAITEGVTVRAAASGDRRMRVHAVDLAAHDDFDLEDIERAPGWRAFARGAAAELMGRGTQLVGARLRITGTVPRGSGLSSSAALEVALCMAMLGVAGEAPPPDLELARLCSRVENDWVGARTGLLDQVASLCGEPERALRVDFRSLEVTPVPLELGDWTLVTLDSGESHANAGGAENGYNRRRAECAEASAALGVPALRDATLEMAAKLPWPLRGRAEHVISDDARVEQTIAALAAHDLDRVGALLNESHTSLRDNFEISTDAVEKTVGRLRAAGAVGARLVGGGFGGHVLGLFPPGVQPPSGALVVAPGPGAHLE
ncbi:MAG TPA: galactokinase family protein [Solirubrobacteraceae bacterium]|nr:galactokinase family protein [Solirubrobacteraceae bacterium]